MEGSAGRARIGREKYIQDNGEGRASGAEERGCTRKDIRKDKERQAIQEGEAGVKRGRRDENGKGA